MTNVKMPEPIAWITNESLHGLKFGRTNSKGAVPVHASRSYIAKTPLITTTQAQAYADERVREALEEAAEEANQWAMHYVEVDTAPDRVGEYVRALIPKQSTPA